MTETVSSIQTIIRWLWRLLRTIAWLAGVEHLRLSRAKAGGGSRSGWLGTGGLNTVFCGGRSQIWHLNCLDTLIYFIAILYFNAVLYYHCHKQQYLFIRRYMMRESVRNKRDLTLQRLLNRQPQSLLNFSKLQGLIASRLQISLQQLAVLPSYLLLLLFS